MKYNLSVVAPEPAAAPVHKTSRRAVSGKDFVSSEAEAPARLDFKLWQVVRSSSAAPTFFPPANIAGIPDGTVSGQPPKNFRLCDGGVCCNNPEGAALAFTMQGAAIKGRLDVRLRDFAILSIGCGASGTSRKVTDTAGSLSWLTSGNLISLFMDGSNDLMSSMMDMLDNDKTAEGVAMGKDQLLRIQVSTFNNKSNDRVSTVLSRMDNADDMNDLLGVGNYLAASRRADLKEFAKNYIFKV